MHTDIHPVPLWIDHCYLVRGEGTILIDGGAPNRIEQFRRTLYSLSVAPEELQLLVLTHEHWDHIACARQIKEITGAQIAMHRHARAPLEGGYVANPPGATTWGRMLIWVIAQATSRVHIPAAEVDVVLGDEGLPLAAYGIPGKVLHTPGHSSGCVSVLLETGEAFVGDLAMNMLPMRLTPGLPIFAEDMQQVRESWQRLLKEGAQTVYPAHGKPFSADVMRKALARG
jgi:glyoxylase-like metal-dependent hydrolase (beta-lactamase superfamily II)